VKLAQLAQLPLLHVQLCPPLATTVPCVYVRQLPCAYGVAQAGVLPLPHTLAVPPPPHVWGAVQVPHELTVREVPQLSVPVTVPQFLPRLAHKAASLSATHALDTRQVGMVWTGSWKKFGVVQVSLALALPASSKYSILIG
jgi:hypothetical protein